MAIISQDWISEGINACTTIKAYVPKNVDYSTIAGDFVGLNPDIGCPEISTSSTTPVAVVLEKFKLKLKFSKDWNFREKISDERVNSPQSARQKSPTALKRLDISIKRTLKIGHRLC